MSFVYDDVAPLDVCNLGENASLECLPDDVRGLSHVLTKEDKNKKDMPNAL
jgi:hypothetical protein